MPARPLDLYSHTLLTHPSDLYSHTHLSSSSVHLYHLLTYHCFSPVFRQQSSKKLAIVVMDSRKQKEQRLNRYAAVCQQSQQFRLLQEAMCHMQFTYALRQLLVCSKAVIADTPCVMIYHEPLYVHTHLIKSVSILGLSACLSFARLQSY